MRERDDRHLDPDERSDLVRVHTGRVHDDVRLDRVALGEPDAGHAPALDVDAGDPRVRSTPARRDAWRPPRAPSSGSSGPGTRRWAGRLPPRPLRRVEQRPQLETPPPSRRCAEVGRRSGPTRPAAGAPRSAPCDDASRSEPTSCQEGSTPVSRASRRYSSTPYIIIFVRLTLDPELPDQPGRVEGRAARELGSGRRGRRRTSPARSGGTRCSRPRHRRRRSRPGRDRPTRQIASVAWSSQRSNRRSAIERESRSKCLSAYAT